MSLQRQALILFILLIALLATGVLLPVGSLTATIFDAPSLTDFFTSYSLRCFINTMAMGAGVALCACAAGFFIAFCIVSQKGREAFWMRALFPCALFAPSVMPAIGLIYLFGYNGFIFQTSLYGATGIFLGALVFTLPHTTMQLMLALERFDARLIDAARSLGTTVFQNFTRILLPHCKKAFINAFLIAFVLTITDFGVPKLLGGNFPMLATEIYNLAIGTQNTPAAAFLSLWLFAPAALAFYFTAKNANPSPVSHATKSLYAGKSPLFLMGRILAWCALLYEVATIAGVIYGSFVTFWPYVPTLTLDNYAFHNSTYGMSPWFNSLLLATSVAVIGTLLAFTGAVIKTRLHCVPRGIATLYDTLASFSLCIPGTVLGLAFAITFGASPLFSGFAGALALLVFNTLVHLFTVSHLTATNTLEAIDPHYETVGQSLGVSVLSVLRRVTLPLARSGMREVFCYLFASTLTTISAVVFLYTPQTMPAAVAAIQMIDSGFISEGAAMSTLIFFSALAVRLVMTKWIH